MFRTVYVASALCLLAVVIVVFVGYCAIEGVLSTPGCSLGLAGDIMRGIDRPARCTALPLAMDIPSLALGLAIVSATVSHVWYVAVIRQFPVRLAGDPVVSLRVGGLSGAPSLLRSSLPSRRTRWVLFVVTAAVGVVFYLSTLKYGYYFREIALGQPMSAVTGKQIQSEWWANYTSHPLAALFWIGTGVAGTYVGTLDLWSYFRLSRRLTDLHATPGVEIEQVLDEESDALRTLTQLEDLKIWAILIFSVTVVAVSILARNPEIVAVNNAGIALVIVFFAGLNLHGFCSVRAAKRRITNEVKSEVDVVVGRRRAALLASAAVPPGAIDVLSASYSVGVSVAKRSIDFTTSKSHARRTVNFAGAALTLYVTVLGVVPAATF